MEKNKNMYPGIDPRITRIVAREVGKMAGRYGITPADHADIEQDLHLKVCSLQLDPEDPDFERKVQRAVINEGRDIIRYRKRQCRDWRLNACSLNAPTGRDMESEEDLGSTLAWEYEMQAVFGLPPEWHTRRAEAADLAEVPERLPADLWALAQSLVANNGNLSAACLELGIKRKAGRCQRERLKKALEYLIE